MGCVTSILILAHMLSPLSGVLCVTMKLSLIVVFYLFSWDVIAMERNTGVIDKLIQNNNYSVELWEPRGLIPSPTAVIISLEKTTNEFLISLRKIHLNDGLTSEQKKEQIQLLVDQLPWLDFDTEEREFLADTIAPAIQSVGFNPWSII